MSACGASARRCSALSALQAVSHWQSASFSRFSQSGIVQTSLACAEQHQSSPRSRAA
jgi:hypothetical protein